MRKIFTAVAAFCLIAIASPGTGWSQVQVQREGENPLYKITINVVERTAKAINYRHRNGATKIDFRGTALLPKAHGEAKVESKQGYIEVEVEFDELQPANRFGPEYLTYVLWAITPEGRATNLGEVILNGTESKLDVTSELQAFGLIVTAEPYFAVSQPSNVVVMENFVRADTVGKVEEIDAKYELLERGQYVVNVPPAELKAMALDKNTPLDLYQARNAVRIAKWAGADKSAADSFKKADQLLQQAEKYKVNKSGTKPIAMTSREAVQTAEDSRLIAVKRQAEDRANAEREAAAAREAAANEQTARARAATEQEALQRAKAEQEGRLEAERRARAEADTLRTKAEAELAAERARAAADQAALRAANEVNNANSEADRAKQAAAQLEREKLELRKRLVDQFNIILATRDSARGLIVNMSDVLFDTGKWELKPGAREKLAKIAGIVLSHPGLMLQVEGHTDSVGSDELNMVLSEKRASSVRDFLMQQGLNINGITAKGYGESLPVADNGSASGRQQNRRVELVVSGDIIGQPLTKPTQQQ